MARTTIETDHTTDAAPEAVWALLADVTTWTDWGVWDVARLRSEAPSGGPGVGAVRELRVERTRSIEKVVTFEPPRLLEYALVGGNIPVRGYRGTVALEPTPSGGTTIRWSSTFKAKLPGTTGMIVGKLQPFIADTARRLGDAAQTLSAPG